MLLVLGWPALLGLPAEAAPPRLEIVVRPELVRRESRVVQPVEVRIRCDEAAGEATLECSYAPARSLNLAKGVQRATAEISEASADTVLRARLRLASGAVVEATRLLSPVRHFTVYLLPHSHVDIGYTHVQSDVEKRQVAHLRRALELARQTRDYPLGARFKWNSEGLWAVDAFLREATPETKAEFADAVREGEIGLDALYGNELTGLCRPEELFALLACARRLRADLHVPIESAMISDVPGYSWGLIPALAESGVRYFSIGMNPDTRIGSALSTWGDRPFYWVSPAGREQVLCWAAGKGYAWFHGSRLGRDSRILDHLARLAEAGYPYEMVEVRYNIGGDNGPPDPDLSDVVRKWNEEHVTPRLRISTTAELFRDLETRYGYGLPRYSGDWTPYWEDGAASSARETALYRGASERLVQADALWAISAPKRYPANDFAAAWRNAVLYGEHTWGAWCSISQPDSPFTLAQWRTKQAFALDADRQSRALCDAVLPRAEGGVDAVDVWNTCSWMRRDVVTVPADWQLAGLRVVDDEGHPVPAQRLHDGRLAFLAEDVPSLGARRFRFAPGEPYLAGNARAAGLALENAGLSLQLNEETGAVEHLRFGAYNAELVDSSGGLGLNDYFYVHGKDPRAAVRNSAPRIEVFEAGPLVASLRVTSDAPGCRSLVRDVRVYSGLSRVEFDNLIDKEKVRDKEGVHFVFPFHVPNGVLRMDTGYAVYRPETDQLPGSCKNWFTVGRFVDASNLDYGATWTTLDAPLVEVGGITAETPWIEHLSPSTTFYSYVMNNYWFTNYKADQEGPTQFRYALDLHGPLDLAAAQRVALERSQPLLVAPATEKTPPAPPLFYIEPPSVLATHLFPADKGKALVVRLYNAGAGPATPRLYWSGKSPRRVDLADPDGRPLSRLLGEFTLPPGGLATLRVVR